MSEEYSLKITTQTNIVKLNNAIDTYKSANINDIEIPVTFKYYTNEVKEPIMVADIEKFTYLINKKSDTNNIENFVNKIYNNRSASYSQISVISTIFNINLESHSNDKCKKNNDISDDHKHNNSPVLNQDNEVNYLTLSYNSNTNIWKHYINYDPKCYLTLILSTSSLKQFIRELKSIIIYIKTLSHTKFKLLPELQQHYHNVYNDIKYKNKDRDIERRLFSIMNKNYIVTDLSQVKRESNISNKYTLENGKPHQSKSMLQERSNIQNEDKSTNKRNKKHHKKEPFSLNSHVIHARFNDNIDTTPVNTPLQSSRPLSVHNSSDSVNDKI